MLLLLQNGLAVFGGWISALADHIVSMTMASALEDGEWFTTTELTTRMFRPMQGGLIRLMLTHDDRLHEGLRL